MTAAQAISLHRTRGTRLLALLLALSLSVTSLDGHASATEFLYFFVRSHTMMNNCFALMGSMGWMGWLMPLAVLLLLGLGIASLTKYLVTFHHSPREDRS